MNAIYKQINSRTADKYKNVRFSKVAFDGGEAVITVICTADDFASVSSDGELRRLF